MLRELEALHMQSRTCLHGSSTAVVKTASCNLPAFHAEREGRHGMVCALPILRKCAARLVQDICLMEVCAQHASDSQSVSKSLFSRKGICGAPLGLGCPCRKKERSTSAE